MKNISGFSRGLREMGANCSYIKHRARKQGKEKFLYLTNRIFSILLDNKIILL